MSSFHQVFITMTLENLMAFLQTYTILLFFENYYLLESDLGHGGEKFYIYEFMTPRVHDYDLGEPDGGLFAVVSNFAIGFASGSPT
jgi:hypothetical protein